jgi:hypothetical protein
MARALAMHNHNASHNTTSQVCLAFQMIDFNLFKIEQAFKNDSKNVESNLGLIDEWL